MTFFIPSRYCIWIIPCLLMTVLPSLHAQILADFENPPSSPPFFAEGTTAVVANPDTSGINTSDSVGYYNKIEGNWHFVNLEFPDTVRIRYNNTLTFKLRTSTQGRI